MNAMNAMNEMPVVSLPSKSIASAAMLVEVSISCWTARKLDKKVSEEVNQAKSASKTAARVNKNLLADDQRLDAIVSYAAAVRNWLNRVTLPWSDNGIRLVTTKQFMEFKAELDVRMAEFDRMVDDFVVMYPTLISAQAFKLGGMFNRDEYPTADAIKHKFGFRYAFMPVPETGDWRVDIAEEAKAELAEHYQSEYQRRIDASMRDVWGRLKDVVEHMSEILTVDEDGKGKRFHESVLNKTVELCDMLKYLNVTGDNELERARAMLEGALFGVTAEEIRKQPAIKQDVKTRMDEILDAFNF